MGTCEKHLCKRTVSVVERYNAPLASGKCASRGIQQSAHESRKYQSHKLENRNAKVPTIEGIACTPHVTTEFTPRRLMFSRDPQTKLPEVRQHVSADDEVHGERKRRSRETENEIASRQTYQSEDDNPERRRRRPGYSTKDRQALHAV